MFPIAGQAGDNEQMTVAAMALLQHRIAGVAHGDAVARVAQSHTLTRAEVDRAWSHHKRDALTELTIGRVVDACPWTEDEIEQLVAIYAGEPWFATPVSAERNRVG